MQNEELIASLNQQLALELPKEISTEEIKNKLSQYINSLIQTNFEKLITLLYRIDVSEAKVKTLLKDNPDKNAGEIIATLIIERQIQKINLRNQFNQQQDVDDKDKW